VLEIGSLAQQPPVLTGTWWSGPQGEPRHGAATVALADGRLLVTGGVGADGSRLSSAVIVEGNGALTAAPSLQVPRSHHAAARLAEGRVLVVGGLLPDGTTTPTAELFDPAASTWTLVGMPSQGRASLTASALPGGGAIVTGSEVRSLVDGTLQSQASAAVERFEPATGTFTPAAALTDARSRHAAAVLADGRVLVAGGSNGSADVASTEIFNLANGLWTSGGALLAPRRDHQRFCCR